MFTPGLTGPHYRQVVLYHPKLQQNCPNLKWKSLMADYKSGEKPPHISMSQKYKKERYYKTF